MLEGSKSWLRQTVAIEPFSAYNDYGEPTYGTAVSNNARIVQKTKMVRDAGGKEVVSTTQIYVNGSATVATTSRITLPDGTKPLILAIDITPDARGNAYLKVIYT